MFEKGKPRHASAGRRKGTPNKKSMLVKEVLENHGINIVDQILVRLPKVGPEEQIRALVGMLPYVYPKLTSVEHSGEINTNPFEGKTIEELREIAREKKLLLK